MLQNRLLSSKQFPKITDLNCSQPMDVQGLRLLVPTFIFENELHFNPRWHPKSSGRARRRNNVANLSVHAMWFTHIC